MLEIWTQLQADCDQVPFCFEFEPIDLPMDPQQVPQSSQKEEADFKKHNARIRSKKARDRKRRYIEELEVRIRDLEMQNMQLYRELQEIKSSFTPKHINFVPFGQQKSLDDRLPTEQTQYGDSPKWCQLTSENNAVDSVSIELQIQEQK